MKDTDWRIQTERICLKGCATKKERKKSQSVHCVKEGNRLQNTDREDTKRNCLGGCVKKRKKEIPIGSPCQGWEQTAECRVKHREFVLKVVL